MAKRIGNVFERMVRNSGVGGAARLYTHDQKLCALLGQSDTLILQLTVYSLDANATDVVISVFGSSNPDDAPRNNGFLLNNPTTCTYNSAGNYTVTINGPTHGYVEVLLTVQKNAGTAQVKADCDLWATIISDGA